MKGTEKDRRRKRDGEEIQTKKGLYITGSKAKNNIFLFLKNGHENEVLNLQDQKTKNYTSWLLFFIYLIVSIKVPQLCFFEYYFSDSVLYSCL